MKRLPNLDALRFLLSSLVIFFHIPQLCKNQGLPYFLDAPLFNRGTEAVYMFFVLSGFLIIRTIYLYKQNDSFSIKRFYIRRMLRILPLYYAIVIFGFVFYWIVLPTLNIPFENTYNLSDGILMTVFFVPNIFAKLYQPGGILEILWSIGIEEQFYLLIAPLLYVISKHRILRVLLIFTLGYFVLYHINLLEQLREFNVVFYLLFFGGVMAILEAKKKLEFLKVFKGIPIIILMAVTLYFTTDIFKMDTLWLYNLITMLLFGLTIHTLAFNNFGVAIKNKFINYLGKISYGIYMYHAIAMNLVVFFMLKVEALEIFSSLMMILLIYIFTFAVTLILAHFSYKYFESYFLKLKVKFR